MNLSEAEKWLDHLTSCSPCYRDFSQFRIAYRNRRTRTLVAIAATIVMAACFVGWALFLRQKALVTETAVLDLRDRSPQRGAEPGPALPPLEMAHNTSHLEIYLPFGSDEGLYDVRLTTTQSESVLVATGNARIEQGLTLLRVDVSPSTIPSGRYILTIRKRSIEWSFPLVVH